MRIAAVADAAERSEANGRPASLAMRQRDDDDDNDDGVGGTVYLLVVAVLMFGEPNRVLELAHPRET